MNPAHVMRCFGAECERRRECGRYADAYLADTPIERTGFNVCEHTRSDRFIPLRQSHSHVTPVYGTHGALHQQIPASEKQGGTLTVGGSQI